MMRSPSLPYVLPFAVFLALLAIMPLLRLAPRTELALWVILLGVSLFFCRGAIDFSVSRWAGSVAVGVAVFVI